MTEKPDAFNLLVGIKKRDNVMFIGGSNGNVHGTVYINRSSPAEAMDWIKDRLREAACAKRSEVYVIDFKDGGRLPIRSINRQRPSGQSYGGGLEMAITTAEAAWEAYKDNRMIHFRELLRQGWASYHDHISTTEIGSRRVRLRIAGAGAAL